MPPRIVNPAASKVFWKKDVAPIAAIIAGACGWMVYKGIQHLSSPDVFLDPSRRTEHVAEGKFSIAEGHEWQKRVATNYRHKDAPVGALGAFEAWSPEYWRKRKEVAEEPEFATRGGEILMKPDVAKDLH